MQTEYKTKFDQLVNGGIALNGVNERITLLAKVDTDFGILVKRDATGELGEVCDNASDAPAGIVACDKNEIGYKEADSALAVVTKGNIAVKVKTGVTVVGGDKAYFIVADKVFTNVATGNIEVGVFQSSVKNDDLAIVKIDILG